MFIFMRTNYNCLFGSNLTQIIVNITSRNMETVTIDSPFYLENQCLYQEYEFLHWVEAICRLLVLQSLLEPPLPLFTREILNMDSYFVLFVILSVHTVCLVMKAQSYPARFTCPEQGYLFLPVALMIVAEHRGMIKIKHFWGWT